MRWLVERVVVMTSLLLLALAVTQGHAPTALVAGLAAVAIAAVLVARGASVPAGHRVITVGARAAEHRQSLSSMPAPSHPNTVGRVRSRAPGGFTPTA